MQSPKNDLGTTPGKSIWSNLLRSVLNTRISCMACKLKLSSTFVYGTNKQCTTIARSNARAEPVLCDFAQLFYESSAKHCKALTIKKPHVVRETAFTLFSNAC